MKEQHNIVGRILVIAALLLVLAVAIAVRILHVQQVEGPAWISKAKIVQPRIDPALRGNIYADDGSLLLTTLPVYRVGIDLKRFATSERTTRADSTLFAKNIDSLGIAMAWLFGDNTADFYRNKIKTAFQKLKKVQKTNLAILKRGIERDTILLQDEPRYLQINTKRISYEKKQEFFRRYFWYRIRRNNPEEQARDKIEGRRTYRFERKALKDLKLFETGINFDVEMTREKPFGNTAARLLGGTEDSLVVNKSDTLGRVLRGATGIEGSFEEHLRGRHGFGYFENLHGSWRPVEETQFHHAEGGEELFSTINVAIQGLAEQALLDNVKRYRAKYGVAIVMERATGEIKAMANLKLTQDSTYVDNENFAIDYRVAPGSTFKLASMMAVLEHNPDLRAETLIPAPSSYKGINNSHGEGFGQVPLSEIFERSLNTGTALITERTFGKTPDSYIDYLKKFHLATPLNFQIKVKKANLSPYIKEPSSKNQSGGWSKSTLRSMSFGSEMQLSALQMLAFYNAVANDGYWVQPIVVKYAKRNGEIVQDFTRSQIRNTTPICSPQTLGFCRMMLEGVVNRPHGTARKLFREKYGIAGKTGTDNKFKNGQQSGMYYSSFIGYFPADAPKYTVLVALDEPINKGGGSVYGGEAAASAFVALSDLLYGMDIALQKKVESPRLAQDFWDAQLASSHPTDLRRIRDAFGMPTRASGWDTAPKGRTSVPNLIGMTLRDALFVLENRGYRVEYQGRGRVSEQSLSPGNNPAVKSIKLVLKQ